MAEYNPPLHVLSHFSGYVSEQDNFSVWKTVWMNEESKTA